jgi:hypothetical protein
MQNSGAKRLKNEEYKEKQITVMLTLTLTNNAFLTT